ncbi:MAG: glycoside hydrolase family 88 protein [Spirosomaceae bacterium]|nr:glycoside hydrolase family 88 protein [Spirosomataceae bacterium]
MKKLVVLLFLIAPQVFAQADLASHEAQLKTALFAVENARSSRPDLCSPRSVRADTLFLVKDRDWTSGFFPGNLWLMYELTGKDFWKDKALENTMHLEHIKNYGGTHDLGFMMYCSFGNALRLTNDASLKPVLVQAAKTLSGRFDEKIGLIRSWDHNSNSWKYPVIIDNMMNLELLFWASKETNDPQFREIAITHAQNTIKHHYRPDGSSFHVVSYDPATGLPEKKNTHQGFSDASAWARGQAWGLYGYTMTYRETGQKEFLDQAVKIGHFLINHPRTPADLIPYWDYDDPAIPHVPRDVSAAAIMASALLELGTFDIPEAPQFLAYGKALIKSIQASYLSPVSTNLGFITDHSTGHLPAKHEIDTPIVYADYYYLEALTRLQKLDK